MADGEFLAIVGPSGCGKTTFLRILDGLIPADGGEVRLGGVPIVAPTPRIGFVFQADSLMPWCSVLDNVALGLVFQGRRDELGRARELASDAPRCAQRCATRPSPPCSVRPAFDGCVGLSRKLARERVAGRGARVGAGGDPDVWVAGDLGQRACGGNPQTGYAPAHGLPVGGAHGRSRRVVTC